MRLAIQVSAEGAIKNVQVLNQEFGKTPTVAKLAGSAIDQLKSQFGGLTAALGIGGGIAIAQKGFEALGGVIRGIGPDLLAAGQASTLASSSFKALAASVGISSQAMLGEARSASKGLITDLDIMAASNKALLLGLPVTAQGFATLAQSATALGRAMGQDAKKSLDDLITGLGRGSAQILDNLGIVVNAEEAQKKYAESIGTTANKLSDSEKKIAVYNAALASMGGNVDRLGGIQLTLADRVQQVKVTFDNVYASAGQALAQSPALITAFEAVSESITGAFGADGKQQVSTFGEYLNTFALGAVETLIYLVEVVTAVRLSILSLKNVAGFLVQHSPFEQFFKPGQIEQWRMGLSDSANALVGANTKNVNSLEALHKKMQQAIADQRALAGVAGKTIPAPKGGPGGGGGAGKVEIKVAELKIPSLPNLWMDLFGSGAQGKHGTLQGGSKTYDFWGDKSKFRPPELEGNVHMGGGKGTPAVERASMSAAQALQNLANIAQLSGSKLGKSLGGLLGGASGIAGGLEGLGKATGALGSLGKFAGKLGMWGQVATGALAIGSSIFGLFKKKKPEPPPEPPKQATAAAWRSFTGDQQSKGTAGILAGVSGIGVSNAADMGSQASIALQSYWQVWRDKGPMAAAEAFKPIRDKMLETFKAAGASDADISAMLGPMSTQIDLAGNKAFAGAAEGMNGFADALASVANQQMPMTVDQFRAYETQAVNGFNQMKQAAIDQGLSMEEATKTAAMASGKYLTTIKDASSKYGIELGGSQALLDEAARAGVMLGSSSEERLIMSLDALTEALGGAPPKFEQAMTAGATAGAQAGGRISEGASSGAIGGASATDIGAAIAGKLTGTFDKLQASLSAAMERPIEVYTSINMDGTAIANGIADTIDRGGGGRLQTALA